MNEDDQRRKQLIQQRLRKSMVGYKQERKYKPLEGFVISWDFCVQIPKKYDKCRMTFGIFCRGETYFSPKIIDDHLCQPKTYNTNLCIFGEKDFLYDIPPDRDAILVIELQLLYNDFQGNPKNEIFGWTMIELFDMKEELMRGKYKIPFYSTKTNPNLMVDELKNIKSIANTLLFLRISYTQDQEFGIDQILVPDLIEAEYYIPFIHRKTIITPYNPNAQEKEEIGKDVTGYWLPKSQDLLHIQQMQFRKILERLDWDKLQKEKKPEIVYIERPPVELTQNNNNHQGFIREGLAVKINGLKNYFERGSFKVRCALMHLSKILIDEGNEKCQFETQVFEVPLSVNFDEEAEYMVDRETILNQKVNLDDVEEYFKIGQILVNDEYIFFTDIPNYVKTNDDCQDEMYLVFQVLAQEVEEDSSKPNNTNQPKLKEIPIENRKWSIITWLAFNIYRGDDTIRSGRFVENTIVPPLQRPPYDVFSLKKDTILLDFNLVSYKYDMNTIDEAMAQFLEMRMRKMFLWESRMKKQLRNIKIYDDNIPFIENLTPQYLDKPFEKGFGIDFYVDACRFLPDNTTITKLQVAFINSDLEIFAQPQASLPDLDSKSCSPVFSFRQELRSPHFDPTLMAYITLLTLDDLTKECRIVGYSIINLFLNHQTKQQPTDHNDKDFLLFNGKYQIPIFCQEPTKSKPFSLQNYKNLEKLPCASILVRLNQAPQDEDGLKTLRTADVPKKDWARLGIWVPMPQYPLGVYNTQFCEIRDSEKELFKYRQVREDINNYEQLQRILSFEGQNDLQTNQQKLQWLDAKIKLSSQTELIDLTYFAKYVQNVGFKFSIDGFHNNSQTSLPTICTYNINIPGNYFESGDVSELFLNSQFNWDSCLNSPKFNEGYYTYKDIDFRKNLCIIIQVMTTKISGKGNKVDIQTIGWTIVPVFTPNMFVKSGLYQMPIVKGPIIKQLLIDMQQTDPWELLQEQINIKKPKYKVQFFESMSVIVRLVDSQRDGHFLIPFDASRMNYKYLPQKNQGKYIYNKAVELRQKTSEKMISLAPNKFKVNEFQEQITSTALNALGIKSFKDEQQQNK